MNKSHVQTHTHAPTACPPTLPYHTHTHAALTQVAYCVDFVSQAIQGGEGTVLLPWLVRLLPGMLKIQRLIPSELQAVSMAARKAVSLLKYLPLMQPALVRSVLDTLVQVWNGDIIWV